MKKTYEKPVVFFESFASSTNIAGNCDPKTHTPSQGYCSYDYEDEFGETVNLFTDDVNACLDKDEDGAFGGFCYHAPFGASLFNS